MLRSLVRFQLAPQKPCQKATSAARLRSVSAALMLLRTEFSSRQGSVYAGVCPGQSVGYPAARGAMAHDGPPVAPGRAPRGSRSGHG